MYPSTVFNDFVVEWGWETLSPRLTNLNHQDFHVFLAPYTSSSYPSFPPSEVRDLRSGCDSGLASRILTLSPASI